MRKSLRRLAAAATLACLDCEAAPPTPRYHIGGHHRASCCGFPALLFLAKSNVTLKYCMYCMDIARHDNLHEGGKIFLEFQICGNWARL